MNWGDRITILNVILSGGSAVGYFMSGDWKRAIYFVLGAAITAVATWLR